MRLLSLGLGFVALLAMAPAHAQQTPPEPPPHNASVTAPVAGEAANQVAAAGPAVPAPAGTVVQAPANVAGQPAGVSAPPGPVAGECSCGERHGLSRWWWHKTRCKRALQECALGYPEEFNEWPLGSSIYAHGRVQVNNGNASRMIFYRYDFEDGSAQLNVRGRDKLAKVAALLPATFYPVVIERTPWAPGLAVERRSVLLSQLSGPRFAVPPERVLIGPPIDTGLTGVEAIFLYGNQLNSLASRGGGGGVASYAGSQGFSGGGLSGSSVTAVPGAR
jgi:hypothetical protein